MSEHHGPLRSLLIAIIVTPIPEMVLSTAGKIGLAVATTIAIEIVRRVFDRVWPKRKP